MFKINNIYYKERVTKVKYFNTEYISKLLIPKNNKFLFLSILCYFKMKAIFCVRNKIIKMNSTIPDQFVVNYYVKI